MTGDIPGDQASPLRAAVASAPRPPRVVAITSGKGGVGKTTLAANLGLELARAGRRVVLVDGDLGLANLAILFNLAPRLTLNDVVDGSCTLADAAMELRPGLSLIPAAPGVASLAELSAERRSALLAEIEAFGERADVVLLDTGAGIGATVLALLGLAHRILLVTTHEPTALSDAYGVFKSAHVRELGPVDLVVNLAASHVHARETHTRLARLTERFLGTSPTLAAIVPREDCVAEAVVRQEPLARIFPYARATRAITALARYLIDTTGTNHARTPFSLALPVRR
jgi:flagellar biosynthesis protein FlhG